MLFSRLMVLLCFCLVCVLIPVVDARAFTEAEKSAISTIVQDTLRQNPEWVMDALTAYQKQQEEKAASERGGAIEKLYADMAAAKSLAMAGNPKGDVTVVEFFDYQCGYCKQVLGAVKQIIAEDAKVRVVLKDFPILGDGSKRAAQAAVAVHFLAKDKYFPFHSALMTHSGMITDDTIFAAAKNVGVPLDALKKEMDSARVKDMIKANTDEALALGLRGTPGFVIGQEFVPGAISADVMKTLIQKERDRLKK